MADSSSPKPANGGGGGGGGGGGEEAVPTNILWVGNIVADTTDADFMGLFAEYGTLDCTARHSSRSWSFAFVYFKDASEAEAAREALQGHGLLGSPIKIDFCHTFKAGKHVWVGGISSNVSEERLEDEFKKFGRIQDFRFFRDRNTCRYQLYQIERCNLRCEKYEEKPVRWRGSAGRLSENEA